MGNSKSKKSYKLRDGRISDSAIIRAYKFAQTNQYRNEILDPSAVLSSASSSVIPLTLVTHCTVDRLPVFQSQVINWNGNVSVSIYLTSKEGKLFRQFLAESVVLNSRSNITYTLVWAEGYFYPINFMRNLALQTAKSEFVFLVDVDFVPNVSLLQHAIENIRLLSSSSSNTRSTALVVPAFETKRRDLQFPSSKDELLRLQHDRIITTFHEENWLKGHEPTDYVRWSNATEPYVVEWAPSYEPFIIVRRDQVPLFDRRFVGYGWDKVSHGMEMAARGFQFVVLPNDYIIHFPHDESSENQLFKTSTQFATCFQKTREHFLKDLEATFGKGNPIIQKYQLKVSPKRKLAGSSKPTYKKSSALSKKQQQKAYLESYKWSQTNQFKVRTFCIDYDYSIVHDDFDVTLVTQLTIDRFPVFESLCQRWTGPVSAAFYVPETELNVLHEFVLFSPILSQRRNIGFHIVNPEGQFYPINYLRNIALQNVRTRYNFLVDVDFLPSNSLYQVLKQDITMYLASNNEKSRACLVIPAFEMLDDEIQFPETKDDLLDALDEERIVPFCKYEWPTGHKPTNYEKWVTASEPYFVNWKPDYEPYIVIDNNVPTYDTRFVGYGWNKISHIMDVAAFGYKFLVLHNAFIVHVPHPDSGAKSTFKTNKYFKKISKRTRREFLTDFRRRNGDEFFLLHWEGTDHDQDEDEWIDDGGGEDDPFSSSISNDDSNGGGCSDSDHDHDYECGERDYREEDQRQDIGNNPIDYESAVITTMMNSMVAYN